jgi:hypothetical protein
MSPPLVLPRVSSSRDVIRLHTVATVKRMAVNMDGFFFASMDRSR